MSLLPWIFPFSFREFLRHRDVDVVILRDAIERHGISNASALRALIRHAMSAPAKRFSVNRFHNSRWGHSGLDYLSPIEYERRSREVPVATSP